MKIRKVQAKSEVKVEKSMMFINVSEKYLKSSILDWKTETHPRVEEFK